MKQERYWYGVTFLCHDVNVPCREVSRRAVRRRRRPAGIRFRWGGRSERARFGWLTAEATKFMTEIERKAKKKINLIRKCRNHKEDKYGPLMGETLTANSRAKKKCSHGGKRHVHICWGGWVFLNILGSRPGNAAAKGPCKLHR